MTDVVTCPADGCDYRGPFRSVVGHYSGRGDDDHAGGYQHVLQALSDSPDGVGDSVDPVGGESDSDPSDGGAQTLSVPGGSDTASVDVDGAAADPECGGCGRGPADDRVFESASYLRRAGDRLPAETAAAIDSCKFVCTSCWKGFGE